MADQGSSDSDKISSLGRGRGRGVGYADPEARATSSSTSEKRPGNGDANGNGKNNANGNGVKRGMSRDQRHLARYHITKPEHIVQKTGTSGQTRMFSANYFRMVLKKNFEFVLYRVDFEPEIENIYMRKAFIGSQRELLGGYIFDGEVMQWEKFNKSLTSNVFYRRKHDLHHTSLGTGRKQLSHQVA